MEGQAYIYDCPYSTLCRQVVTDADGRVVEFDVSTGTTNVKVNGRDPEMKVAIDRIVLVPLSNWSIDYVKPVSQCVRDEGECVPSVYPAAPDGSVMILMSDGNQDKLASFPPSGIYDLNTPLVMLDEKNPLVHISGNVPDPGYYVIVAHYYQPEKPEIQIPISIKENPTRPKWKGPVKTAAGINLQV